MKTINQTLKTSDRVLGNWLGWTNDVMNRLDKLRITPKKQIPVTFTPSEYTSTNGRKWKCQHASVSLDYVPLGYEDIEIRSVCDDCGAQLIGEEWIDEL